MTGLDVITIGRVSADLYPEQIGCSLADVKSFSKTLGGSPTNVAVAAARLGRRTAVITKVGSDGFGDYVRTALASFGVDNRWVGTDKELRTPLAFCEVHPPDHFPLLFYREPKAPDMNLLPSDVDLSAVIGVPLFWTTGTGLSDEPSRSTTLGALDVRASGITVHDLDFRPMLWRKDADPTRWAKDAISRSTVVVGNLDEVEMATGTRDPVRAADVLLGMGPELAIVKQGAQGVYARRGGDAVLVPPVAVKVVCGLGAGDAFGGALCHGLLSGWELERVISFANAAGAIVASRLACADAMPTAAEVDALLSGRAYG